MYNFEDDEHENFEANCKEARNAACKIVSDVALREQAQKAMDKKKEQKKRAENELTQ